MPLAWPECDAGPRIDWVGAHLAINTAERELAVTLQEKIRQEFETLTQTILADPTVGVRALQRHCGKASFVAGLSSI